MYAMRLASSSGTWPDENGTRLLWMQSQYTALSGRQTVMKPSRSQIFLRAIRFENTANE